MEKMDNNNVLVFLDVSIDGDPSERMIFELFTDVAPKTAENFRALCTGEKGVSLNTKKPLHYKGTFFHRIIKRRLAEAGDFLRQDGKYGESIFDGKFPDESPKLRHDGPGLLSMAIADRDERGSLFAVTFKNDHHLDKKRIVFGKLVDGYDVLKKIENAGDDKGIPAVTVKIVNSGELHNDGRRENKLKMETDGTEEKIRGVKRKGKHKKSSRKRRKRRRYYTSESDSSTDTDTVSSASDTDSDSYASSLSDTSSSSDNKRKRRIRSNRGRHRRGRDGGKKHKRREKRRRRRDKKSKRKSKRDIVFDSDSGGSSQDVAVGASDGKHNPSGNNQSPLVERLNEKVSRKKVEEADIFEREEGVLAKENGDHQSHNTGKRMDCDTSADRRLDGVDILPSKSRSASLSPTRTKSKSMSISPRIAARSPDVAAKHYRSSKSRSASLSPKRTNSKSMSVTPRAVARSPDIAANLNRSRSPSVSRSPQPISRSRSITPARSDSSRSPLRTKRETSVSISRSRSATWFSLSRSSGKPSRRSLSRSPVRLSPRSVSRSSGRAPPPRRSPTRSPVKAPRRGYRPSYSGSPVSAGRRARSPVPVCGRSSSRSPSVDGSPRRVRRGRGVIDRYSYARHYRSRSRSPERSSVRSYRVTGRIDRDRYSSYRRSPRRYRSPPRGRTPPRYRGKRSPSLSRSPIRYRGRRDSRSRSPVRSRSPMERYRGGSPRTLKRRRSSSPSRSLSKSPSSRGSQSPVTAGKIRSRSLSRSPP